MSSVKAVSFLITVIIRNSDCWTENLVFENERGGFAVIVHVRARG